MRGLKAVSVSRYIFPHFGKWYLQQKAVGVLVGWLCRDTYAESVEWTFGQCYRTHPCGHSYPVGTNGKPFWPRNEKMTATLLLPLGDVSTNGFGSGWSSSSRCQSFIRIINRRS